MENAVYWNGRQVGIECAGKILWFSSAPPEAIAAYDPPRTVQPSAEETLVTRNLATMAPFDRWGIH